MLCCVVLCYVMLCYVKLCYVMLCYVMLCYVTLRYVLDSLLNALEHGKTEEGCTTKIQHLFQYWNKFKGGMLARMRSPSGNSRHTT